LGVCEEGKKMQGREDGDDEEEVEGERKLT